MPTHREVHLVRRPEGAPRRDDFALVRAPSPQPAEGEVLVEGLVLSVDPYMRGRLSGEQALGEALFGGGLGRVLQSRHPDFASGDLVRHFAGFREVFAVPAERLTRLHAEPARPLEVYLHALGITGMTAYGGLLDIGRPAEGETVFVSSAAGAVGSLVAQIARLRGCRVIGATGRDDKAAWLREIGLDAVINYRRDPLGPALAAAAPDGIDIYFDNVGGAHLEAVLGHMRPGGRIPVCGMISTYGPGADPGVKGLSQIIYKRVRIEGFVGYFPHLQPAFEADMGAWLADGAVVARQTVYDGLDHAADAFLDMLAGANFGKMLVRLQPA